MVVSLGESLIDFIGDGDLRFTGFPGGSPFNTSIAIARLGVPVQFFGRVSRDLFGQRLLDHLRLNSVKTDLVISCDDSTTLGFVKKDAKGQAEYAFFSEKTADRNLTYHDFAQIVLPEDLRIIHFGSISYSQEPCGSAIHRFLLENRHDCLLSFDPNIRPDLVDNPDHYRSRFKEICGITDILKLSEEDLQWLLPGKAHDAAITELLSLGPALVVLTLGEKGASITGESHRLHVGVSIPKVVDTVGAGDTFHGAFLAYLYRNDCCSRKLLESLDEKTLYKAGMFASQAAALNCQRSGADPPTLAELKMEL